MPPKRQAAWNELKAKMAAKRARAETGKRGKNTTAPHELIVQRLAAEPDNKQTFKPVSPREFVAFDHDELNLTNLKRACAKHFNLPAASCDVLVSNKGPSCTNIAQIAHRKDKVYLVRFVLMQDHDFPDEEDEEDVPSYNSRSQPLTPPKKDVSCPFAKETRYPASISIGDLLQAGKLVKPKPKEVVVLQLEQFDVKTREWQHKGNLELAIESTKFDSGAFRDAYKGEEIKKQDGKIWVVKTYNEKATNTIRDDLGSTLEDHTRKQVQMHEVARHVTKGFSMKVPAEFGQCFSYNHVFFTKFKDTVATVEEYIEGTFMKYVNNDGECIHPPEPCSMDCMEVFAKAQTLVHYSYCASNNKMMVLDIQGSMYRLYDPEISTELLHVEDTNEVYFCCGNLSSLGIRGFLENHVCNKYCRMMALPID